jgi:hypothetical protein
MVRRKGLAWPQSIIPVTHTKLGEEGIVRLGTGSFLNFFRQKREDDPLRAGQGMSTSNSEKGAFCQLESQEHALGLRCRPPNYVGMPRRDVITFDFQARFVDSCHG